MSEEFDNSKTWLVFSVGEKKYALLASSVREILRDVPVFPLPFVPEYINGILNRYGEPYAVVDPLPLLTGEAQKSKLFIVLHGKDHLCLKISEVLEFFTTKDEEIKFFSLSDSGKYYVGSFGFEQDEVLILNSQAFVEIVEKDVESA